jgi:HEAT repeat protein
MNVSSKIGITIALTMILLGALRLPAAAQDQDPLAGVLKALKSPDRQTRRQAAAYLEKLGAKAKSAVLPLIEALGDKDWAVRSLTARTLATCACACRLPLPCRRSIVSPTWPCP